MLVRIFLSANVKVAVLRQKKHTIEQNPHAGVSDLRLVRNLFPSATAPMFLL